MLSAKLPSWFRRPPEAANAVTPPQDVLVPTDLRPEVAAPVPVEARIAWPDARLTITDLLWGDGFITPGGEIEILRLVRPLGLSSASSMLLVGAGGGGPAGTIVRNTGAWVNALEVDPILVEKAQALLKAGHFGKKASVEAWDPEHPEFAQRRHHHCLALEPLSSGDQPEPILDGLSQTVKLSGQLVMTELVADTPLVAGDTSVSRWGRLERRKLASIPTSDGISRMLARVGFDVRIVEDISMRHRQNAMIGWRVLVRALKEGRPDNLLAAQLVVEAEMWLLRIRLLSEKRVKMMRWHAIARAQSRAPVP